MPDDGDLLVGDVDAQPAEVAPHGLPRAARGDPHPLVVVAGRPARRERVAEPEAAPAAISFATSENVAVPLSAATTRYGSSPSWRTTPLGRDDPALDDVVGDVEQRAHERAVGVDEPSRAAVFTTNPPLAPTGTMTRVLDHLRLHQPEDLGAEVLVAVRPAQTAAGDGPAAQVYALGAPASRRRPRPTAAAAAAARSREESSLSAVCRCPAIGRAGTRAGRTTVRIQGQDAVLVEAGDRLDLGDDPCVELLGARRVRALGIAAAPRTARRASRRCRGARAAST